MNALSLQDASRACPPRGVTLIPSGPLWHVTASICAISNTAPHGYAAMQADLGKRCRTRDRLAWLACLASLPVLAGCAALDAGNWQVFGPPGVYVGPPPAAVAPAPLIVTPPPRIVTPAPTIIAPPPVVVAPLSPPYVVVPPPLPRSSRDAAHFLRERCYRQKGGCYTTEHQGGYVFDPYTGAWDWVDQRHYRWKGHRKRR